MTGLRCENRYRMVRVLGKGSFGEIRVAQDQFLGREVAIKVIQAQFANDKSVLDRFAREAETLAKLEHPHITPIHDSGRLEDGRPYFSMQLVIGETLEQRAIDFHERHKRTSGEARFAASEFQELLRQLRDAAQAIVYAHQHGIVHRDVKPSNILISQSGDVFLIDWGTAKEVAVTGRPGEMDFGATLRPGNSDDSPQAIPAGTLQGEILGTPAFMSPEQANGQTERVSTQSDIFGLGAALYYLLTGRPPHRGDLLTEVLSRAQQGEITSARSIAEHAPEALILICDRALAIDPSDRYPTSEAFVHDLQRYLDSQTGPVVPVTSATDKPQPRRRSSVGATLAWLFVFVLANTCGGLYWYFNQATQDQADTIASLRHELDDALATPAVDSNRPAPPSNEIEVEQHPKYVELQAQLKQVTEQLDDAERRLQQADQRKDSSQQVVSQQTDELEELQGRLKQRDQELEKAQSQLEETQRQLQVAQTKSSGGDTQVNDLQQQLADLKRDLAETQASLDDEIDRVKLRESERDELSKQVGQLQKELMISREKSDALRALMDEQAKSIAALKEEVRFQSHMDGDQLVELLKREGKTAVLVEENHLEIKGEPVTSQLYVMANGDLLISSVFDKGEWSAEIVNEWNRERILSRAYLDEDDHVVLESDLTAPDGLSDRAVQSFLKSYQDSLDTMKIFLEARQPSPRSSSPSVGREY